MEEHEHNWHLAEYIKGKTIYKTIAVGMSTLDVAAGKKPDSSRFVCSCGETKEVVHEQIPLV